MSDPAATGRTALLPVVLMVAVTAVWGLTFVTVKQAVAVYPPITFLAARFLIAALLLGGFAARGRSAARLGLGIGLVVAVGYIFQTYGLTTVSPSVAGLLTGLFVVFAPLCDAAFYRIATPLVTWAALGVALLGMVALTFGGNVGPGTLVGEGLLLLCAIAFGAQISLLSRHSRHHSPFALAGWQMLACAALFSAGAAGSGNLRPPSAALLPALLLTGVGASAVGFLAQTYVQRHLSAARAALLFTAEPAFAVLFGVTLAHDAITPFRVVGVVLILLALVGHEAIVARGRPEGEIVG
ncbi:MAG TPA: DMT family transporter [Candidatus Dormibacteraeota bacterium]|nr:DMT family transporter [Candidatus Dormibacteraeota bacterium]